MTKSTIPDEWLQPLVTAKVVELNCEATKYYGTIEKNNLDLIAKLEVATEALKFYAEQKHIITKNTDDADEPNALWVEGFVEDGNVAQKALMEIAGV